MIRYSTPTITVETDIELENLTEIWLSFKQKDIILRKTKSDMTINNNSLTIKLMQEETAKFRANELVQVQLRWLDGEEAGGSNIVDIIFSEALEDEVISSAN